MDMTKKLVFSVVLPVSVCLAPLVAAAQGTGTAPAAASQQQPTSTDDLAPISQVTLGAQWVGGSNTNLFGRYNGFTEKGFDILAGFTVQKRDPPDSGGTWYYDIGGANLDFQTGNSLARGFSDSGYVNDTSNDLGPEAEISLKLGNQGTWGLTADYDAISYTGDVVDSIYTVNGTNATLNNNLPAWGGATNNPLKVGPITSYTVAGLSPAEQPVQVGTRRDILQLGGNWLFDDWTLSTNIRHEHKEGSMDQTLFLNDTFSGMAFAMPVDYDTNRFEIEAAYNDPDLQAVLQYTFSQFTDNNQSVVVRSPVSGASITPFSGPPAQSANYSLAPSNSAHYLTGMLGDNVAPGTRITLNGRLGVELQDSTFPANSADPNLSSGLGAPAFQWFTNLNSMNQGTSATSPDDIAWVYQGNLAIDSALATDLDGRASYSFDGRSVHLNQREVWTGAFAPDSSAGYPSYVVPQDWFNQTAKLEASYRLVPENNTKLTATYSFNDIDRTNAQVEHSVTNTESLQLSSMIGPALLGLLTYEHADRSGTLIYGTAWGNLENGAPAYYGTPSGAYYQAPMTSNAVTARLDFAPQGNLTGGLYLKWVDENYNYPSVPNSAAACTAACAAGDWSLSGYGTGIKEDYNLTVGPDISYKPVPAVNLHGYYTYERIYYNNLGNGACAESNTGLCAGSAGYYQNTYTSGMNSAGFSGDWQTTAKLTLKAEYNLAYGLISFGEFNGVEVLNVTQTYQNVTPYPSVNSEMNQVKVAASYKFAEHIEASLIYQYSMFRNNDWDYTGTPIIAQSQLTPTAISTLTPGYGAPHYYVSSIGTVLRITL